MKILKPLIIICLTLVCFGFSTPMYDRAEIAPDLPKGDPDPEKGLVVRRDSTAYDVLQESSSTIQLGVNRLSETKLRNKIIPAHISSILSPIPDKRPKSLKYIDEQASFTIKDIYAPRLNFSSSGKMDWSELTFFPFMAHDYRYKPDIEARLKEITEALDNTSWIEKKESYSDPFIYPTGSFNDSAKNFKVYEHRNMWLAVIVKIGYPEIHKFSEDNPKYNIEIRMRKKFAESIT